MPRRVLREPTPAVADEMAGIEEFEVVWSRSCEAAAREDSRLKELRDRVDKVRTVIEERPRQQRGCQRENEGNR